MYTARIVVLTIALSAGGAAGKTVILELKPEQAETLARARQNGTPALAPRSIVDINMAENRSDDPTLWHSGSVNVVRYGVLRPTTTQK
jgi:pilus assembly protein CpaB